MAVLFQEPQAMYYYRVTGQIHIVLTSLVHIDIEAEGTFCGLTMTAEHVVITYTSCILVYDTKTFTEWRINTTDNHHAFIDRYKVVSISDKGLVQFHSLLSHRLGHTSTCYSLTGSVARAYVDSTCIVLSDYSGDIVYSEFGADASEQRQRFCLNAFDSPAARTTRISDWQLHLDGVVHINHLIIELHDQAVCFYKHLADVSHSSFVDQLKAGIKAIHVALQILNERGTSWYLASVLANLEETLVYEQQMQAMTEACNQLIDTVRLTGQVDKLFAQICQNVEAVAHSSELKELYASPDYVARKVAAVLGRTHMCFDSIISDLHDRKKALIPSIEGCAVRIEQQLATIKASVAATVHHDRSTLAADATITHEAKKLWADITRSIAVLQTLPTENLARAFDCTTGVLSPVLSQQRLQIEQLQHLDISMHDAFANLEPCQVQLLLLLHGITEHTSIEDVEIALNALRDYADITTDCYMRLSTGMRLEVQTRVKEYHDFIDSVANLLVTDTLPLNEETARLDSIKSLELLDAALNKLGKMRGLFPGLAISIGESWRR
eukprot:TRINITY_DN5581_c0_g1_i4.p1 TRINITY_DN5581_c0_g1~~TRINITY_DN5581_c0_g1_i4.p1  ORF type:complete len:553 (+),score=86.42 TRINITY_DN5581_c0_g1_i4:1137-2795(+)